MLWHIKFLERGADEKKKTTKRHPLQMMNRQLYLTQPERPKSLAQSSGPWRTMHGRRMSGTVSSQAMEGCDSVSFCVTLLNVLNPNLYINAEVIEGDLEVSPPLFGHPCVLVSPKTPET